MSHRALFERLPIPAAELIAVAVESGEPAPVHPGTLDENGCPYDTATGRYHCHRDPKLNHAVSALARKSRENVCHDHSSPNYSTLEYFVGGRAFGS